VGVCTLLKLVLDQVGNDQRAATSFGVYANLDMGMRLTDSSFDTDVGGLREWQRASVQQKGVFDKELCECRSLSTERR
jgi:hypothetical protein